MALMASSKDVSKAWLVSLARRNDGEDIDAKSCSSLRHDKALRCSRYAATLLIIASKAGYIASNLPLLLVMRVCIDCRGQ